jgi:hypothetical protein
MFDFSEPVGFTIFCDDIREEASGKLNLIGTYDKVMVIHVPFPVTLPKFGFHIRIYTPASLEVERDFPINVIVYLPGDETDTPSLSSMLLADPEAAKSGLENLPWQPTGEHPLLARITLNWILSPLILKEPGIIRVLADYKGDSLRCGSLRVISADALTADRKSQTPS